MEPLRLGRSGLNMLYIKELEYGFSSSNTDLKVFRAKGCTNEETASISIAGGLFISVPGRVVLMGIGDC